MRGWVAQGRFSYSRPRRVRWSSACRTSLKKQKGGFAPTKPTGVITKWGNAESLRLDVIVSDKVDDPCLFELRESYRASVHKVDLIGVACVRACVYMSASRVRRRRQRITNAPPCCVDDRPRWSRT
jgi:hypothetical protein